jgi:broad specificity phosphatase PhoE
MVFVSPRERAHKTFHLLFAHLPELPAHVTDELVSEWDYGDYEGLKSSEINATRPGWDIWKDGYAHHTRSTPSMANRIVYRCPGGESVEEMTFRIDTVIERVPL